MLISAIMPTRDRAAYVPVAIRCFLDQTYEPKELIILDDGRAPISHLIPANPRIHHLKVAPGRTLGAKRNLCANVAQGEVIIHWDDDDWSAPGRINDQIKRLISSCKSVTGYNGLLLWDEVAGKGYRAAGAKDWAAGTSLCYWRHWQQAHRFENVNVAEDSHFQAYARENGEIIAVDGSAMLVSRRHPANTWKLACIEKTYPRFPKAYFPLQFFQDIQ